jgi:hypothetical protein
MGNMHGAHPVFVQTFFVQTLQDDMQNGATPCAVCCHAPQLIVDQPQGKPL